jgi:hypothetical protein
MAHLQFIDVQERHTEFLDFTSLTLDEFHQLVPPFEAAFQAHMAVWRLDGTPRTARPNPARLACTRTTPCRCRKAGCSFCSHTWRRTAFKWSRGACLAWARAKPISGFTCSCPRCWPPCAPSAMPRPAPWQPWRSGSAWPRPTRLLWSFRWRRSWCPPPRSPLACRRPPFCPGRDGTAHRPPPRPC